MNDDDPGWDMRYYESKGTSRPSIRRIPKTAYRCKVCGRITLYGRMHRTLDKHGPTSNARIYPKRHKDGDEACPGQNLEAQWVTIWVNVGRSGNVRKSEVAEAIRRQERFMGRP